MQEFFEYEVTFSDPNGGPTTIVIRCSAPSPVQAACDAVDKFAAVYTPVYGMNIKVERV